MRGKRWREREKSLDLLEKGGSGREGMCRMIVMIVMIVVIVVITVAMTAMIVTMMITAPTTTDVMIAIAAMIARNTPIIITGIIHNLARNPTTITEDDPIIIIIIIIITQPSHPPLHFFSRQLPTFLLFHPFLHLLPYTLPANSSRQLPPFLFFSRQPRFSRQFFIRITHFLRQLPRGK